MSKVKIKRYDKWRVLLTEVLPYETPMIFSNNGFYVTSKSETLIQHFEQKIKNGYSRYEPKGKKKAFTIPFSYNVRRSDPKKTRKLSVIHPFTQHLFVDFYNTYDSIIIHSCSKSPFTLRAPNSIAKYFYQSDLAFEEDTTVNDGVEVAEINRIDSKVLKSYFTYKPIDLIYKFFEKLSYRRLEQRFHHRIEFDNRKCFYNIYTHSITWAIKGKEYAKQNHKHSSFETKFDKIVQLSNYNETNGIVVGPEFSRIFAEIVLQAIDLQVLAKLEEQGFKFKVDYNIKRYVDDYFVFTIDLKLGERIQKIFKENLEEYKLYINERKSLVRERPFITDIGVGKIELKNRIKDLFNYLITEKLIEKGDEEIKINEISSISSPFKICKNFINDFQCILKKNDLDYSILSNDVVRKIKSELIKKLKSSNLIYNDSNLTNYLLVILEIAFYAYSLNINSSNTFKIAQLIVVIVKFLNNKSEDVKQIIHTKIASECNFIYDLSMQSDNREVTKIEILNLLIACTKLDESFLLSERRIREIFSLKKSKDYSDLNYFEIISLLYYIGENATYSRLRENIEKGIKRKIRESESPFKYAEITMLLFDIITCPFISEATKDNILLKSNYAMETNLADSKNKIKDQKIWFVNWNRNEIDLERTLKRKEWSSAY